MAKRWRSNQGWHCIDADTVDPTQIVHFFQKMQILFAPIPALFGDSLYYCLLLIGILGLDSIQSC